MLKCWPWRKIGLVLVAIIFVLFVASFGTVAVYQICGPDEYTHAKECAQYNLGSSILLWIVGIIDGHNGLVTAVATVFVAGFTWTLWRTSAEQSRLTRASINLGTREFISTHRPKIIVRAFEMGDKELPVDTSILVLFVAQNIGESTAHIQQIRSRVLIHDARYQIPTNLTLRPTIVDGQMIAYDIPLKGGEKELFSVDDGTAPRNNESMEVYGETKNLYCIGVILYSDDNGTERETGFCRKWNFRADGWETIGNSEYEYAY